MFKRVDLQKKDLIFSQSLFRTLASQHYKENEGVCRLGYSTESKWATDHISALAKTYLQGVSLYEDFAGTRYIVLEPRDPKAKAKPALLMGSHLDAVPRGGQYDGMLGVVSALQTMEIISRGSFKIQQPLAVVMFSNEESSRFEYAVSSKIAVGRFHPDKLQLRDKLGPGTLSEAMEETGLDISRLKQKLVSGEALMPDEEVAGFVEAHIEQEDSLADEGYDIGFVEAVYGSLRCGYVRFDGVASHSGSCPQDKRRDAVLAGAHFMVQLEQQMTELAHCGNVVWSFGDTRVSGGGSQNIVSPNNEVLFDIRSDQLNLLQRAYDIVCDVGRLTALSRNLHFTLEAPKVVLQPPVRMNEEMLDGFVRAASQLGLRYKVMPSGAGHDSAVIQESGRKAGLIFVPHKGGSHHPAESMTIHEEDDPFHSDGGYAKAVRLLVSYAVGHVLGTCDRRAESSGFVANLLKRGARSIPG